MERLGGGCDGGGCNSRGLGDPVVRDGTIVRGGEAWLHGSRVAMGTDDGAERMGSEMIGWWMLWDV